MNACCFLILEVGAVIDLAVTEVIGVGLVGTTRSEEITSHIGLLEVIGTVGILEDGDVVEGSSYGSLSSDGAHAEK